MIQDDKERRAVFMREAVRAGGAVAGVCIGAGVAIGSWIEAFMGATLLAPHAATANAMSTGAGAMFGTFIAAPVAGWMGWRAYRTLDGDEKDTWVYRLVVTLVVLAAVLFFIQVLVVATIPNPNDPYN